MATLQQRIEDATSQIEKDADILNKVANGDAQTTVPTDSGDLDSVAKKVADIEAALNTETERLISDTEAKTDKALEDMDTEVQERLGTIDEYEEELAESVNTAAGHETASANSADTAKQEADRAETAARQAEAVADIGAASTTQSGIVELATVTEAKAGTDTSLVVTPAGLSAAIDDYAPVAASTTQSGIVELATVTEAKAGTDTSLVVTPAGLAASVQIAIEESDANKGIVLISGNDTAPSHLDSKIIAGPAILKSIQNEGGNEKLTLGVNAGTSANQIVQLDGSGKLSSSLLTGALPAIDGSALTGITSPAIIQVKTFQTSSTFSTSAPALSDTKISNIACSITPTSTSSKIIVQCFWCGEVSPYPHNIMGLFYRGSTVLRTSASGSSRGISPLALSFSNDYDSTLESMTLNYIDSPETTSSVTYYLGFNIGSANTTIYTNRTVAYSTSVNYEKGMTTMILMEIAS